MCRIALLTPPLWGCAMGGMLHPRQTPAISFGAGGTSERDVSAHSALIPGSKKSFHTPWKGTLGQSAAR